jgi:hypothetical protein
MALAALKDLVLDDALTKPLALPLSGSPAGPVSVADYAKALPEFERLSGERVAHFRFKSNQARSRYQEYFEFIAGTARRRVESH